MTTFSLDTTKRNIFVDITSEVARLAEKSGVSEGVCLVFVPHTTAGVTINENADPDVVRDLLKCLDKLVPSDFPFSHTEGNSDAHMKASLMGSGVTVPVSGGRLMLGTWQGIYFTEFDGPRRRQVSVTVLGVADGRTA